ncbi:MAG: sulfatase-like hydrolase/transferase, partial [Myxococcota bacterium]|nr:sulfatase-like hydrolase/transferase [Myxococcota bacterium]
MRHLRVIIALVVVANLLLVGWLLTRTQDGAQPGSVGEAVAPLLATQTMEEARYDLTDRADELNILFISLDALRYDHTGIGGHEGGITPNLDRFADESIVFHDAISASAWTLPSHMSIWTARWPSVHAVTNKLRLLSGDKMVPTTLSPGIETYPDLLIRDGVIAGGFTGGAGVQASYGFGRDFDAYLDDRYFGGLDYSIPAALKWIEEHRDQQFFLFLHGYDTHGQYALPDSEISALRQEYGGALDGSKEEQAELRERGLAAIENPGDAPDLRDSLSEEDAAFLAQVY